MKQLRRVVVADWLNSPEHVSDWLVDSESETYPSNQAFVNAERVRLLIDALREDGSWPDVDYNDQRREAWPAIEHFTTHLHPMVLAYASAGAPLYHDPELKTKIISVINFWLRNDYTNPNWWNNMIGLPAYYLGPALLVMQDDLSAEAITKGVEILSRCDLRHKAEWRTGGNALYDCRAAIMSGLFTNDAGLVSRVFETELTQWLCVTPAQGSGVKEDYSHWEHGNLLFNHGYGSLLLTEGARLLSYARALSLPVKNEALDFLTRYLLDGSQWMVRGEFLDYAADGRGVANPDASKAGKKNYLAIGARYLLRAGASREEELREVIDRAQGKAAPVAGNRVFPFSDFMTHSRPSFYASVRMSSIRTLNTEICNGANRLGYHLGTGSMYLVRRGDEYKDIFPVWDWNMVPGTTGAIADLKDHGIDELADSGWFPQPDPETEGFGRGRLRVSRMGRTAFVGGVSDGRYGVAAFDQKVLSLSARKSWFFLDAGYVCLGAGIENRELSPVLTTVNQCALVGDVSSIDKNGREIRLHTGTFALPGTRAVYHDGVSYVFPGRQEVVCANQVQSGDWQRINVNQPDSLVEQKVFSLWIEHGSKPEAETYCYGVFPDVSLAQATEQKDSLEILSNTAQLQAVRDMTPGVTGAVFFTDGMLGLGESRFIRVSAPCIILLSENEKRIYVSDPTWTVSRIQIELDGEILRAELSCGQTIVLPVHS